mmetsp:Transcript_48801/g.81090  ORF Transcript_48801/g.81090 Transcript_48801/m.81090 type:complete len:303 (-) Transcript_48801:2568-3476(-)
MNLWDLKPCSNTRESAVQSCPRTSTAMSLFVSSFPICSRLFPVAAPFAKCSSIPMTAFDRTNSASAGGCIMAARCEDWLDGFLLEVFEDDGTATPDGVAGVCPAVIPSRSRKPQPPLVPGIPPMLDRLARPPASRAAACNAACVTAAVDWLLALERGASVASARGGLCSLSCRLASSSSLSSFFTLSRSSGSSLTCSSSFFNLFSIASERITVVEDDISASSAAASWPDTPSLRGRLLLEYRAPALAPFAPVLLRAICLMRSVSSRCLAFSSSSCAKRRVSSAALRRARISARRPPCCLRVR